MNRAPALLAAVLAASALAAPAFAAPPGHVSLSWDVFVLSSADYKDGVGIADPADRNNPCTFLITGTRIDTMHPLGEWQTDRTPNPVDQPVEALYWKGDLRIGTNLNGPGVGISNLVPPLTPVGGWLPASGGINLGVACPIPQSGPGALWLVWSGVNWRSFEDEMFAELHLCTLQIQIIGCWPESTDGYTLIASACSNGGATFTHDYTDAKGKELGGVPWDLLGFKNDQILCTPRHSHDYTSTVVNFGLGYVSQAYDRIKTEAMVHAGSGTTYIAVCWVVDYVDFSNPLAPVELTAQTHDWKLILDVNDPAGPAGWAAALQLHFGGQQAGDSSVGANTVALRGIYSESPTSAGQNGFGPCPFSAPLPEAKKPAPIV
jgi:hypothetical protein